MFAPRKVVALAAVVLVLVVTPAHASNHSPSADAPVQVILTNGDTLVARVVQPAPFDMAAVVSGSGAVQYVPLVQIQAVRHESGDVTSRVVDRRKTVGEPLPRPVRVPRPPKPQRVGPRSVTKTFLLTEASWLGRADFHEHRRGDQDVVFGSDIGEMFNVSTHMAIGYSGFFSWGDEYESAGARLWVRRWVTGTSSIDLAPTLIIGEYREHAKAVSPGFAIQMGLSPSRYLTLNVTAFSVRRRDEVYGSGFEARRLSYTEPYRDTGVLVGLRVGRWPGAVAGGLVAMLAVADGALHSMEQTSPVP